MKKSERISSGPKISTNLFTKREIEVIRLICRQYSSQEIADKIGVNIRTIESFRESIVRKTKARNKIQIIILFRFIDLANIIHTD